MTMGYREALNSAEELVPCRCSGKHQAREKQVPCLFCHRWTDDHHALCDVHADLLAVP